MKTGSPKLSIIIPVYNVAPYLEACLRSVIDAAQEVEKIGGGGQWRVEIICVDDGSTDDSSAILEDISLHSPPPPTLSTFTILHQQNRGVGAARNAALEAATGDWVMFVDGDDVLSPGGFADVFRVIESASSSVDLLRFGLMRFEDRFEPAADRGACVTEDVATVFRAKDFDVPFVRYAYRRSVIGETRFKGYSRGEDQLFLCECLLKSARIASIPGVVYGYRQRSGSAVRREWTARALADQLNYYRDFMTRLRVSSRVVDASVFRTRGKFLTEGAVAAIRSLPREDRTAAWRHWFASVAVFRRVGGFSPWVRFVLAACGSTRSRAVATVLCYMPHWLKRKGFHR